MSRREDHVIEVTKKRPGDSKRRPTSTPASSVGDYSSLEGIGTERAVSDEKIPLVESRMQRWSMPSAKRVGETVKWAIYGGMIGASTAAVPAGFVVLGKWAHGKNEAACKFIKENAQLYGCNSTITHFEAPSDCTSYGNFPAACNTTAEFNELYDDAKTAAREAGDEAARDVVGMAMGIAMAVGGVAGLVAGARYGATKKLPAAAAAAEAAADEETGTAYQRLN